MGWHRNSDGQGQLLPGHVPGWLAPCWPLLCPPPSAVHSGCPCIAWQGYTHPMTRSHPPLTQPTFLQHHQYSRENTRIRLKKWDARFAPFCLSKASNSRLTAFLTDTKLFSNSRFVHHACRQLSQWNLGTSQTGPQGTRENSPTNKHTEYRWRGCNLAGESREKEGDFPLESLQSPQWARGA